MDAAPARDSQYTQKVGLVSAFNSSFVFSGFSNISIVQGVIH